MRKYRLIIAGGRKYARRWQPDLKRWTYDDVELQTAFRKLNRLAGKIALGRPLKDAIIVVEGGAEGADRVGRMWAESHGIEVETFEADWEGLGKRAGYVRNADMAEVGDYLAAFWNGSSKGTKMMIELSRKKGIKTAVIRYTGE